MSLLLILKYFSRLFFIINIRFCSIVRLTVRVTVRVYHANILPTDISSHRSKNFLISNGIIIKSKITNAWVIFSSINCSLLTKVIFKWVLTKPFCQNISDMMLQKKLNSFYDRMNCSF